jgi:hypothetical protein
MVRGAGLSRYEPLLRSMPSLLELRDAWPERPWKRLIVAGVANKRFFSSYLAACSRNLY